MVQGRAALQAQLDAVPKYITEEVTKAVEKICNEIVRDMRGVAPHPKIAAAIDWSWGDAPAGALTVGTFKGKSYGAINATVFVRRNPAFYAHWFEFGTRPRVQKTTGRSAGQMTAQPFFYPVIRANKRLFRNRLRAAINRAVKRANQRR